MIENIIIRIQTNKIMKRNFCLIQLEKSENEAPAYIALGIDPIF